MGEGRSEVQMFEVCEKAMLTGDKLAAAKMLQHPRGIACII